MTILRQAIRGCASLPHVGEHPGTPFLIMMIVMGFASGLRRGLFAGVLGGVVMGIVFGSMYLRGAYGRAEISDHLTSQVRR
jgi:hypothetical protein